MNKASDNFCKSSSVTPEPLLYVGLLEYTVSFPVEAAAPAAAAPATTAPPANAVPATGILGRLVGGGAFPGFGVSMVLPFNFTTDWFSPLDYENIYFQTYQMVLVHLGMEQVKDSWVKRLKLLVDCYRHFRQFLPKFWNL